jgi:plastocyanin
LAATEGIDRLGETPIREAIDMMRTTRWAVALAVVLTLAACGGGGGGGATTDSVTMVDNAFQPSEFTAASDTLTVTNEGQALHSFTVDDAGIDQDVQPGESTEIDLSGADAGSFELHCKYHPEMTGTITVQ